MVPWRNRGPIGAGGPSRIASTGGEDKEDIGRVTPEHPVQSPFAPGVEPVGGASPPSPGGRGSPFAPPGGAREHDGPRLGIAHLLVGTACVAVYLGLAQTSQELCAEIYDSAERSVAEQGIWILFAVGAGIALGGLPLWITRRRRGMPFPCYPGEHLLMVQATLSLLGLGVGMLWPALYVLLGETGMYRVWSGVFFLYLLLRAAAYSSGAIWVAVRAWRRYFCLCAAVELLGGACVCCSGVPADSPNRVLYVLVSVVLLAIVIREHRRGLRFPWTHWLGVAVRLWFMALSALYLALLWTGMLYGPGVE